MLLPDISGAKRIAIDTETYDPDLKTKGGSVRTGGYVVGIAVATDDHSWYFPIEHEQGQNMDRSEVIAWAKKMFALPMDKVFANAMYDLDYLAHMGITVGGRIHDVQIAEPLIDESARSYSLDNLAQKYLKESKVDDELYEYCATHFGGRVGRAQAGNIWRCPADIVAPYARGDVELPLRILDKQLEVIERESLHQVYDMECALLPMLLAMRQRGVAVNKGRVDELKEEYAVEIPKIQDSINDMAGMHVNVNAAQSLAEAFENLGIEYATTELGTPSFTADILKANDHPIAQLILDLKRATKMSTVFLEGYLSKYAIEHGGGDWRVHTHFNQLRSDEYGTVSGRFSSSYPNLQNIPAGEAMRSLYIPDEGEDWYKLDYSQVEYRIASHYGTGENAQRVRDMYLQNPKMDFHQQIADMVGIDRKPAKNINFGMLYGMGVKKLSADLGLTMNEGKELFAKYHGQAPFVKQLADKAMQAADKRGFIFTLAGRRRRFNEWEPQWWQKGNFPKPYEEALAEYGPRIKRAYTYKALNSVIQGSAADVMKMAMLDVWKSGACDVVGAPLLTVHDELDLSVPRTKEGQEAVKEIQHAMENACPISVPLLVDVEKGTNWGDVQEI